MVTFHPRATLGLGNPVPTRLGLRTEWEVFDGCEGVTWHWTGGGGTLFHPDPIQRLRGIWSYHVNTLGYGDIAYEGGFDADGNTYELRPSKYVSAHAASGPTNRANRRTNGFVFLEDRRGFTPAALDAFMWWHNVWRLAHKGRLPQHWTHDYWGTHGGKPTGCPGPGLHQVVKFIGGNVAA